MVSNDPEFEQDRTEGLFAVSEGVWVGIWQLWTAENSLGVGIE